jgi:uncharacterized protein (DUF1778 family)
MTATPRLSWNLRVTPSDQELIDRAVAASGLTRTDFVLQAARSAALEPEASAAFQRKLDAPPANPNERLQRTMAAALQA